METHMTEQTEKINQIHRIVEQIAITRHRAQRNDTNLIMYKNIIDTVIVIVVVLFVQYVMKVLGATKEKW